MSDHTPSRSLSEIAGLFLTSVRDRNGNGAAAPRRIPPGKRNESDVELTPAELAQVAEADEGASPLPASEGVIPPVTAVLASHLAGRPIERACDYARHLSASGQRVGLIVVDASEFRLLCFDGEEPGDEAIESESFDPRQMTEALSELSCDLDRWLLLVPTAREPEARLLLREVKSWVALCACDHDGVIGCYQAIKRLSNVYGEGVSRPTLTLALLDPVDEAHAQRVHGKVASVCGQFLQWPLDMEIVASSGDRIAAHAVLSCRAMHDKTQVAAGAQWQVVKELLQRASDRPSEPDMNDEQRRWAQRLGKSEAPRDPAPEAAAPAPQSEPQAPATSPETVAEVIDLDPDAGDVAILSAILQHRAGEVVQCPIAPPMCPQARLAVGRDHRMILFALARQGLNDLPLIGQAYEWVVQNRQLIGMAMPQLAIDATQQPQLSLIIDRADSTAHRLGSIVERGRVTVQTYRRLRWSGRTGLLLEAA